MKHLKKDEKFIIGVIFSIFFLVGVYALSVSTMIPIMREEYGFNYEMSGFLISANAIGALAMSLIASYTALLFGLKRAFIIQHALVIIGMLALTMTGRPAFLLVFMVIIGMGRSSTSNYSVLITNELTKSDAGALNLLTVFYAVGACIVPFFVFFCAYTLGNWRYTCYFVAAAAAVGILVSFKMKLVSANDKPETAKRGGLSFFKRKDYWLPLLMLFFSLCMELSIYGWIIPFFRDGHNTTAQFASTMLTLVWITMLAGRLICSIIVNRIKKSTLLLILTIGMAISVVLFVSVSHTAVLIAATVGIGLFMSGYYSTVVAEAGPVLSEYKVAFGYFLTLSGLGSVSMPALIGIVAERQGILAGIRMLIGVVAVLLVLAVWNVRNGKKVALEISYRR